jgi:hypothetical protein
MPKWAGVGGGIKAKTADAAVTCRCGNSVYMAVTTYNLTVVACTSALSSTKYMTGFVYFLAITLRDNCSISFSHCGVESVRIVPYILPYFNVNFSP